MKPEELEEKILKNTHCEVLGEWVKKMDDRAGNGSPLVPWAEQAQIVEVCGKG